MSVPSPEPRRPCRRRGARDFGSRLPAPALSLPTSVETACGGVSSRARGLRGIRSPAAPRSGGPGGTRESSPMFQHWVMAPLFYLRPGGTADDGRRGPVGVRRQVPLDAEETQGGLRRPVGPGTRSSVPPGRRSFYRLNPTMNRWALVQMSLRDNGLRKRRPLLPTSAAHRSPGLSATPALSIPRAAGVFPFRSHRRLVIVAGG